MVISSLYSSFSCPAKGLILSVIATSCNFPYWKSDSAFYDAMLNNSAFWSKVHIYRADFAREVPNRVCPRDVWASWKDIMECRFGWGGESVSEIWWGWSHVSASSQFSRPKAVTFFSEDVASYVRLRLVHTYLKLPEHNPSYILPQLHRQN